MIEFKLDPTQPVPEAPERTPEVFQGCETIWGFIGATVLDTPEGLGVVSGEHYTWFASWDEFHAATNAVMSQLNNGLEDPDED